MPRLDMEELNDALDYMEMDMSWGEGRYNDARREGLCAKCMYSLVCLNDGYASKIPTIKAYRVETGASLATAKRYVESNMLCQPTED